MTSAERGINDMEYSEALDALAHTAREFLTAAAYTVRVDAEDEFLSALEAAETLLADAPEQKDER